MSTKLNANAYIRIRGIILNCHHTTSFAPRDKHPYYTHTMMNTTNNKNISASRSIAPPPSQHAKPSQQGQGKSTACDDDDDDDKDGLRSILAAAIGLTSLGAPKKANASTPTHDDGSLPDGPFESSSGPTTKIDKSQEPARKKSKLKKKTKKYKMPKTAVTKEARSTSVPSPQRHDNDRQPVTPYPHLFPDYPNPPTSSSTSPPHQRRRRMHRYLPNVRRLINDRGRPRPSRLP